MIPLNKSSKLIADALAAEIFELYTEVAHDVPIEPPKTRGWCNCDRTPLVIRLARLLETIPIEDRRSGVSFRALQERLSGAQSGRITNNPALGAALRELGYYRKRDWTDRAGGYRAYWYPPETKQPANAETKQ